MKKEVDISAASEKAMCAKINLENMAKFQPAVKANPMFLLVSVQIDSVIDLLDGGDGEMEFD